jgi:Transposase IS4
MGCAAIEDLLNDRFAAALRPPRDLVCDETMVAYRGDHPSFRRMENKPISRGFLIWKLACRSGYVYRQLLCYGSSGKSGVMNEVVLSLVNPYLGEHRVVYFDSAFTSIDLLLTLWNRHTYAVGKVHPIRVFPYHARHATLTKDAFVTVQHRDCVGLSATACKFNDWRSELLSTATDLPMATVQITPRHNTQSYPAPAVLQQYNAFCGGVDEANRLAAFRALHRKHYRAYMTFFEHFVNVAMSNAWVVYDQWARHHAPRLPHATYSEFVWQLSTELIGTFSDRQRPVGRPPLALAGGVHRHIKSAPDEFGQRLSVRCKCFSRAGGVIVGHRTVWRCTCGAVVCETDPNCWQKHLIAVPANPSDDL